MVTSNVKVVYVPHANAHGTDSFQYEANDCTGDIFRVSEPGTITIDIEAINDVPTLAVDTLAATTNADEAIDFGVIVADVETAASEFVIDITSLPTGTESQFYDGTTPVSPAALPHRLTNALKVLSFRFDSLAGLETSALTDGELLRTTAATSVSFTATDPDGGVLTSAVRLQLYAATFSCVAAGFYVRNGVCEVCPLGHYCMNERAIPCPADTFNPETGSHSEGECQRCPTDARSPAASTRMQDCTCAPGSFDETNGRDVVCVACPTPGSECTTGGLTLATLPVASGYWRWSNASTDLRRCEFEAACVGGAGDSCAPGLTGPYCQLCTANASNPALYFDEDSQGCVECATKQISASQAGLAAMLALLLAVLLAARHAHLSRVMRVMRSLKQSLQLRLQLRARFKILASTLQILSSLNVVYQLDLPDSVQRLVGAFDAISLQLDVFAPAHCLGLGSFRRYLAFYCFAPLVLLVLLLVACVTRQLLHGSGSGDSAGTVLSRPARVLTGLLDAMPWALLLLFLVSPLVNREGFRAFSCDTFGEEGDEHGDGVRLLVADWNVPCDTDDAEYSEIRSLGWLTVAIYAIALPGIFACLLFHERHAIRDKKRTLLAHALNFLSADYSDAFFWWEIVEILRKTSLAGFLVLFAQGSARQLFVAVFVQSGFLFFQGAASPYRLAKDNALALSCHFGTLGVLAGSLVLKIAAVSDDLAGTSISVRNFLYFDDESMTAIMVLLIIQIIGTFVLVSAADLSHVPHVMHLAQTGAPPLLDLDAKHHYHLFLSHIWGTAQDQNATIKRQLCLLLPGVRVFLDVDDLQDIGALEEYIGDSQVVQFFCSKGYFKSRNCLREVRTTLANKQRFCLVHDGDKALLSLEAIRDTECPDDLRSPVFQDADGNDRDVIKWHRVSDFQVVSLKLIVEQLLLGCPTYKGGSEASVRLFVPNGIARRFWRLKRGAKVVLYASPNNPGAVAAATSLHEALPLLQNHCPPTALIDNEVQPTHMLLYLNNETFLGEAGEELAREVRHHLIAPVTIRAAARQVTQRAILQKVQSGHVAKQSSTKAILTKEQSEEAVVLEEASTEAPRVSHATTSNVPRARRLPLLMVHEKKPDAGGCEFARFFETTPHDLIAGGLYRALACPLHPGAFHPVSVALVAQAAGALDSQPLSVRLACGMLPNRGQQIGGAKGKSVVERLGSISGKLGQEVSSFVERQRVSLTRSSSVGRSSVTGREGSSSGNMHAEVQPV